MEVTLPKAYEELVRPHRYKVLYGGRAGGKSTGIAIALLLLGYDRKLRILCTREIQRSIADSVHKLLSDQIDALGLSGFYAITRDSIRGANGTEFIFKGLHANSQEIKSTEGINICWVEEAMSVSEESWKVLIPTIREEGSEIWVSFNPYSESDPVYKRFIVNHAPDSYVRKINYDENPYFPDTLRKEMEWLKEHDYQEYLHVWEGEIKKQTDALVFKDHFEVREFETPPKARFYFGADWGFANDPSTLIRTYMDGRTIYIDYEAWGVGVDIDETPALFDIVPAARDWPIYADCARPETISYMAKHGFRCKPAPKWQGSIEDGIAWLRAHDIVIHSRCKHLIDEFNRYSYKTDKITGDILPIIVDKYNHGIDALRYAYSNEIQNRNSSWAGLIS
jgi:phage terminase large subunit